MFRKLCVEKAEWVELLQDDLLRQWRLILMELETINEIRIDRCYFIENSTPVTVQLHASIEAYAAVVYLQVMYSDNSVTSMILASKTRVSPLKVQTISRLELLSAVILSRLFTTIRDRLSSLKPVDMFLWTDSTLVLCWLRSNKPCKQYVSSRINEIHRLTSKENWHHCSGALNPADMPSRGVKGSKLLGSRTWWEGPLFLKLAKEKWPCSDVTDVCEVAQDELISSPPEVVHTLETYVASGARSLVKVFDVIDCTQFSNLHRLLVVTAFTL